MYCKMYTDGGSRENPGQAAIGIVIYDKNNKIIKTISKAIGIATNNVAEYSALLVGVLALKELKCTEVEMFLDSELIVKQLNKIYRVKDHKMKKLYKKVMDNLKNIDWTATHVRREKNKVADSLVNDALDAL
jgi:ribonuclease HI